jgi:hypothetical protein
MSPPHGGALGGEIERLADAQPGFGFKFPIRFI